MDYINRPYLVNGLIVNLKTSIGMALDPSYSLSSFDLLDNACTATRHAEIDRFKSVYLFEPEMENHRVQHRKIRTDLRKAISQISPHADHMFKTSSFEVVYQPKVDLSTRKLLGLGALLRWQHPIYGPVSPEIFSPICEEIGLINVLGGWVIQIACQDASQWPLSSDQEHLSVAVNLSPAQLSDRDLLLTSISSAIESSSLSPETLEFELTERDFHDTFHDVINEIKSLGCKLSIDDFGVKYSSLSRLKEVPFDSLKIDRSFIKDIGEDTPQPNRDRALWMLRNIALLGKSLRLKVIAEGVETEEQAMLALGAGCSIMQGYLVSRPIKAADVNQFISEYTNQHSGEHIYEP